MTRSYSRDHREDLSNLGYLVDFLFENEFEKYCNEPVVFRQFSNFFLEKAIGFVIRRRRPEDTISILVLTMSMNDTSAR